MPKVTDKITEIDINALRAQINTLQAQVDAIPVVETFTAVNSAGNISVSDSTDVFELVSIELTGIPAGTPVFVSAGFWARGADSDATHLNGIIIRGTTSHLTKQRFELWDTDATMGCHLSIIGITTEADQTWSLSANMEHTSDTVTVVGASSSFGPRINVLAFK